MTSLHLSRDLVLEERSTVSDGLGGYREAWVTVGRLWAEVIAGAGRDVPGEEITLSSVPYRITVRGAPVGSDARPRPDQRFRDGPRAFRIVAVTERDRHGMYLLCFAREEVPS
jgi:head-tail adaptor